MVIASIVFFTLNMFFPLVYITVGLQKHLLQTLTVSAS